jgi:signal transduction histidine kinase
MRRRAFWGVVAAVVITLTAAGLTGLLLINNSVRDSVRAEFERQAAATARLVETAATDPRPGGPGVQTQLRSLLGVAAAVGGHDYVEAARIGPNGVIVSAGTETILLDLSPVPIEGLTRPLQFEAEIDGESVAAYVIPVRVGEGKVVVAIGTELQIVPWNGVLLRFGWAIGLGVLLASLFAGWLARFLAHRLDGLRGASALMAAGDLGARVGVEHDDEVAEVETAFNEMAEAVQGARRREREFLVSVSHDLRTPLTTIRGYTEALDEGRVASDDVDRVTGVIRREADRLGRLVEDLMLLSRIEAREFGLRPEPVDLAGHLGGVAEAFRGRADEAGVALESDLPGLPEVSVDPDRVAQIVGNLLENALRYTPEGGRVVLRLEDADGFARISVADTGPGIAAADLPHIFERLYVTGRYRPVRPEGSGLGLAIVKELVEAMGGSTRVESTPGEGTTLSVLLPMSPPTSA